MSGDLEQFGERYVFWYGWSIRKDGSRGSRLIPQSARYTPINTCEVCGFWHGPRRVCCRNGVWGWDLDGANDYRPSKVMLCTGCWNRVRGIVKKMDEAALLRSSMNKLQSAYREQKRKERQTMKGLM